MATVTFSTDSLTLALPAPELDARHSASRPQGLGRTAAGGVFVYDSGLAYYGAKLQLRGLTVAQKENLVEFFHAVKAAQLSFVYVDPEGQEYAARFCTSILAFIKRAPDIWDAEVELDLEETESGS